MGQKFAKFVPPTNLIHRLNIVQPIIPPTSKNHRPGINKQVQCLTNIDQHRKVLLKSLENMGVIGGRWMISPCDCNNLLYSWFFSLQFFSEFGAFHVLNAIKKYITIYILYTHTNIRIYIHRTKHDELMIVTSLEDSVRSQQEQYRTEAINGV